MTLTNGGSSPHSIDSDAARIAPDRAFRDAKPGEFFTFRFKAVDPGVLIYHCGPTPVLAHIANGMSGAVEHQRRPRHGLHRRRRRRLPPRAYAAAAMRRRVQQLGNVFVILLLRSPLHRSASGSLILLGYRGRRSGRRFTVPVMYAEDGAELIVFVGHPERKSWWRNLRGGAAVEVLLRGRLLRGQAAVSTDTATASSYLERYPRARAAAGAESQPTFVRITALEPAA